MVDHPSSTTDPSPVRARTARSRAGLCALLALLLAFACTSGPEGPFAPSATGPVLRVGTTPTYPPVVFEDDGQLRGIEPELARVVGRELGREVRFVELDWDALLPALDSNQVDVVMSGVSITPERAQRVLFTDPYMRVGQLAMIRSADLATFGRPGMLEETGARIGYVRNTTGAKYVAESLPDAEAFAFASADDGIRALRAGRVDFFVHDAPTIWRYTLDPGNRDLMGLYRALTDEYLAWAVAKGDTALQAQLNGVLNDLREGGRLDPILRKWVPIRVVVRD